MSPISHVMAITNLERRKLKKLRAVILKKTDPKKYIDEKMNEWKRKLVKVWTALESARKDFNTTTVAREREMLDDRLRYLKDKYDREFRIMKKTMMFFISMKTSVKIPAVRNSRLRVALELEARREQDRTNQAQCYCRAVLEQLIEIKGDCLDKRWSKPLLK